MDAFFKPNSAVSGVKGLILLGKRTVTLVRDYNTDDHPGYIDLLGGAAEPEDSSPFQTLAREVREESGLTIVEGDITYARIYPSFKKPGTFTYFAVAQLAAEREAELKLGDEGSSLQLMTPQEFIGNIKAWDFLKKRLQHYLDSPA